MASTKRTVIEISSGSDDDNPLVTRRKIRRRSKIPEPQRKEADKESTQSQPTFAEFLSQTLPSRLISGDVANYIQRESNVRLETARQEGITLDTVFIGMDCLPTWIGMHWDPQRESLHCAIQDRLMDVEVSSTLGDVLRRDLIEKGNRKLEEARQLGLGIEDIMIGKGLLATWDTLASTQESAYGLETPPGETSTETTVQDSSVFGQAETPESETITISTASGAPNSPEIVYDSSSTYDSCSDFSSSSGGNSSSTEDDEQVDDVIHMNNVVNTQPEYSESDDEAPHILHDVEVVGGFEGHPDVDLEVYLVEDDDEVEDLPELELAIDGDAFIHYFGDDGLMEVEIPGMDLQCSLDVPPDQSDEGNDHTERGPPLEEIEDDSDDQVMDENEDNEADENEGGEQISIIQITEDGFTW
ncbi:uncharacterized protein Triagg1_2053 [Trichoderma aggressivum f. europaeum]|uniref:Uncharacterized protein n=1 Tax=Trichoderma aggressivum f. europaeum TaxID=173218 RepID=A0AAE1JC71_9HYPO|nr:hypothetical protein Triagg1_2053 [Trichoderma aggressivum f. europaeum]